MTLHGEIARFKVFPGHRTPHHFVVLVFAHKGFMRRAFHQLNISRDHDDRFGAVVMPQEHQRLIRGKWKSDPSLGYALFACTQLDMETQCHEAIHLATTYLRRTGRHPRLHKQITEGEETLAYCAGRCAAKLNRGFHKFRCYRRK